MSLSGFLINVTILGIFTEQQLVAGQTVQVMSTDYQTHNLISPFSISDKSIAVHNHECAQSYGVRVYSVSNFKYTSNLRYSPCSPLQDTVEGNQVQKETFGRLFAVDGDHVLVTVDTQNDTALFFVYLSTLVSYLRGTAYNFGSHLNAVEISGHVVAATSENVLAAYVFNETVDETNSFRYQINGKFSGKLSIGQHRTAIATVYTPNGGDPAILTFYCINGNLSVCGYLDWYIDQSAIPDRDPTTTFGTNIAVGGPLDLFLAVTDSAAGELYVFSFDGEDWRYNSTINIGVGGGHLLKMYNVGLVTIVAVSSTQCTGGISTCIVLYTIRFDGVWTRAHQIGDNRITEFDTIGFMWNSAYGTALKWNAKTSSSKELAHIVFTIKDASPPPVAPSLVVTNNFFLQASVNTSWQVSNDMDVISIEFQYRKASDSDWSTVVQNATTTNFTLPCLVPGEQYFVRAALINTYGTGPYSQITLDVHSTTFFTGGKYYTCNSWISCVSPICYDERINCDSKQVDTIIPYNSIYNFALSNLYQFQCGIFGSQLCCDYIYTHREGTTYTVQNKSTCANPSQTAKLTYAYKKESMTQGGQTASRADNYHVYLNINSVNKTAVVLSICGQEFIDENPSVIAEENDEQPGGIKPRSPSAAALLYPLTFVLYMLSTLFMLM